MAERPPNIVLIMTDQQRYDTVAAAGHPHVITPNLDRLARGGVLFSDAFCPGATCVASRAAMFTGMFPHNSGVYSFQRWAHHRNVVKELAEAGYYCANLGKMHLMPLYDSGGFHERRVVENKSTPYGKGLPADEWSLFLARHGIERPTTRHLTYGDWDSRQCAVVWEHDEELHADSFVGSMAEAWIRSTELDRPLFLQIGFPGPHEPYDPPERFLRLYDCREVPLPVRGEAELSGKPVQQRTLQSYFRNARADARIDVQEAAEESLARMRKHYYANVTLIDERIGRILDALAESGLLESSIVIFTSDHGDNLGDHGLPYKWLMYDPVVRVPLIVRDFRAGGEDSFAVTPSGGMRHDGLVSLIDLAPTLLELAGVTIPDYMDGRSLLPILQGRADPADRSYVFCEDNYLTMVRSRTHKLVYYIDQPSGELYDLAADPHELRNLHDDPAAAGLVREYETVLLHWLARSSYFNGRYRTDGSRNYATRWPSDPRFGPYLQGFPAAGGGGR